MVELTKTEKTIYNLLIEGFSTTEIAKFLNIKYSTFRSHLNHIFEKKGVSSQNELIVLHYRGKVRNG